MMWGWLSTGRRKTDVLLLYSIKYFIPIAVIIYLVLDYLMT
jgi:hypothetical protein